MGSNATATFTFGAKLDEIPWTEEEREDCDNDKHQWLAEKLGIIPEGKEGTCAWLFVKDGDWPVKWVDSGTADDEGPYILGVREMTTKGSWEGPTEANENVFEWSSSIAAKKIFEKAWEKIEPGVKTPELAWYLTAYWG